MSDRQLSSSRGKTDSISVPESFFTQVMPKIQELAELKAVLYVVYLVLRKQDASTRRCEYSVTYKGLKSEVCRLSGELGEETLRQALDSAVKHGILIHSTSNINGMHEDVYSLTIGGFQASAINVFALYEQNIGMITPMIAEELKEAERIYPPQWIEEAFKEAVALNKRSWRYVARILERWASEGKDSGEHKRNTKKIDPDKYVKGRYGHLVKR